MKNCNKLKESVNEAKDRACNSIDNNFPVDLAVLRNAVIELSDEISELNKHYIADKRVEDVADRAEKAFRLDKFEFAIDKNKNEIRKLKYLIDTKKDKRGV